MREVGGQSHEPAILDAGNHDRHARPDFRVIFARELQREVGQSNDDVNLTVLVLPSHQSEEVGH